LKGIKLRLEAAEEELRFKMWIRVERLIENTSEQELEEYCRTGAYSPRLDPPPGASRLDTLDRATLLRLWKQSEQTWRGRNREDLVFWTSWPLA
jgi:hypothetical protein